MDENSGRISCPVPRRLRSPNHARWVKRFCLQLLVQEKLELKYFPFVCLRFHVGRSK